MLTRHVRVQMQGACVALPYTATPMQLGWVGLLQVKLPCMYVRTYVCLYVCMYVCTYVCMYVCCLGPLQCTAAHLHKASGPATGNIAATTPGLLLKGSATLLLPGLYSHLYVNICKYSDHLVCLLDSTACVCRYTRGLWSVTTVSISAVTPSKCPHGMSNANRRSSVHANSFIRNFTAALGLQFAGLVT